MQELKLSEFGLMTVTEACGARGWSPKTVQNWVRAGLLPAVVLGSGRGAYFLVRRSDVEGFTPPPRGRPGKDGAGRKAAKAAGRKGKGARLAVTTAGRL